MNKGQIAGVVAGQFGKDVANAFITENNANRELLMSEWKDQRQLSLQERLAEMQEERKMRAEERAKAKRSADVSGARAEIQKRKQSMDDGSYPGEMPVSDMEMARELAAKGADDGLVSRYAAFGAAEAAERNRAEDVAYRDKRAEKSDAQADRQFGLQQQQFEIAKKEAASRLNLLTQQITTAELGNEKLVKINAAMDEAISADTPQKSAAADRKLLTLLGKTTKTEAQQENLNALVGILKQTNNTLAEVDLPASERKAASDLRRDIYAKLKAHFGDDDVITDMRKK